MLGKRNNILIIPVFLVSILFCVSCDPSYRSDTTLIRIDLNRKGAAIEKYIYGQFIEHLGRCIYGGIWAEMIMDRKFYYPVTWEFDPYGTDSDPFWNTGPYQYLKASPWQVIGNENTVMMNNKDPFTGEHTPEIHGDGHVKSGIKQGGLGIVHGQKYVGRIVLSGEEPVLPVTIRISSAEGDSLIIMQEKITRDYASYPFEFVSDFSSEDAVLEIFSHGHGKFRIGTISLMPSDNIKGWRADVVQLMKGLNAPVYRWPGGNFVSGYNWKDGIGTRDKRPPRKNPAWKGIEHNDVGIHEYMELMDILNAEPFIAVNTGLGTVEEVAEEIEYCNGSLDTPMGKLRAENGHAEPFKVKWWAVGNEMYGQWQLGHMPLADYVKKHIAMAEAIWEKDPNARLIAVGAVGEWSETMLRNAGDYMDLLSEHIYVKELDSIPGHTGQLKQNIHRVAEMHRKYRKEISTLQDKNIRIAMDEWNYWYGDYIYGELGVRYHHKDAMGVAMGLHEYFRNSDIYFMANYAQTVNVIGCIKTTGTASCYAATALPLILYRNHFGTIPLAITDKVEGIDIMAALNEDQTKITLSIVNVFPETKALFFDFAGFKINPEGRQWLIHHHDPEAYNIPGNEPEIKIVENELMLSNQQASVPGYSIMMFEFEII